MSLLFPEDGATSVNGQEVSDGNDIKASLLAFCMGMGFLFIRFKLMKYRKSSDFSDDVPLPDNVDFEKTDDVAENIRRYKQAQKKAVEKTKRKE
ncbi:hypothetical protein BTA51_01125 [Hahella sp. CCB-MM4]|nr:hypothetical protein BTA51_01125 [Hahella sp. CCB-MM4]